MTGRFVVVVGKLAMAMRFLELLTMVAATTTTAAAASGRFLRDDGSLTLFLLKFALTLLSHAKQIGHGVFQTTVVLVGRVCCYFYLVGSCIIIDKVKGCKDTIPWK